MSDELDALFRAQLHASLNKPAAPPAQVKRRDLVTTYGPWSNGHDEQCAIVTHVQGEGVAPGTFVNLHVFVDEGPSMIASEVPWFATRAEAEQAMTASQDSFSNAGPKVCYFA